MTIKSGMKKQGRNFTAACREKGLRVTPQRIAVFEALASAGEHPTVEAVYKKTQKNLPNISFDTVYRTINTFVEKGMARNVESFNGMRRFDADTGEHHHFTCLKCGKISDFISEEYNRLKIPRDIARKFRVVSKKVLIEGVCDKCEP